MMLMCADYPSFLLNRWFLPNALLDYFKLKLAKIDLWDLVRMELRIQSWHPMVKPFKSCQRFDQLPWVNCHVWIDLKAWIFLHVGISIILLIKAKDSSCQFTLGRLFGEFKKKQPPLHIHRKKNSYAYFRTKTTRYIL